MSVPGAPPKVGLRVLVLVVGIAVAVVVAALAFAVLSAAPSTTTSTNAPGGSSHPGSPGSGGTLSIVSHAGTVNHAGNANRGVSGTYGPATVVNETWAIGAGPTTTTPSLGVRSQSRLFVFVGYVNGGGGGVRSVTDSLADGYTLVLSSGPTANYSEDLYESNPIASNTTTDVSAAFSSPAGTMGGSVAAVDVATTVGTPTVDVVYSQRGSGGTASVLVTTTLSYDLLLLGVTGARTAAPLVAGPGETLLGTEGAATGPGNLSDGFGFFTASENGKANNLSAGLSTPGIWAAIGVGIYGFEETGTPGMTTTPTFGVANGSVIFLFVGFVDTSIGGGYVNNITDTLGDTYTSLASTGIEQNHSEILYVSSAVHTSGDTYVTVGFAGGATPMGGSVAAVDVVASAGAPVVGAFATDTGAWSGTATVSVTTNSTDQLLLLGVSGMGRAAPFAATGNESLLDTGTNTSGPFFDGTGFATLSAGPAGTVSNLSATLNTPAEWEAIGVAIAAVAPSGSTVVPATGAAPGPTLLAAVTRES